MATFEIIEGKPGQGKSLYTARMARKLLKRNKKYFLKTGVKRVIYSNIKFSAEFEKEAGDYLAYWSTVWAIVHLNNCDLLWDEIATELDSRNFANLSEDLKRFLSQYRKRGVDIYANTQDFSMIDMRARLMVTRVASLWKMLGSKDPSATKPVIKRIWGIIMIRDVVNILADDSHNKKYNMVFELMLIDRTDIEIYDTTQDIPLSPPMPLRHIVRKCEHADDSSHECKFCKIQHV